MFNGFDFSVLLGGAVTVNTGTEYTVERGNGTYDQLFGTGLVLGPDAFGRPVVTGTIFSYYFGEGDSSQDTYLMGVTDISVSFRDVIAAALTATLADDALILRNAFGGEDEILASDFNDVVSGFAGNDIVTAYAGNDVAFGGEGNDDVHGGNGNDVVYGELGNDIVNGGWDGDQVFGNAGNDTCLGGEDAGNDIVHGDDGVDIVRGGAGIDQCFGDAGNDQVFGEAGNDTLYGGLGLDTLTGGANNDRFVFNTRPAATNYDRIVDFYAPQDTIVLENGVMAVGAVGPMSAALFWKSATGLAHDANDRIIYETDTGWLNYDGNGNAAGGAVHLALLGKNLPLTSSDFVVI
jgi:Ca2+-binding RTX toxin-like protein